jgi:hypothetical protein
MKQVNMESFLKNAIQTTKGVLFVLLKESLIHGLS